MNKYRIPAFGTPPKPSYEEQLSCLSGDDFFDFFQAINAEPEWRTCGGKECIKVLTLCHGGNHHNAAFDPVSHKITCFSECGTTMMLHTWVARVLGTDNPYEGKELIENWIADMDIDLSDAVPGAGDGSSHYCTQPFDPHMEVEPVPGIDRAILADLYSHFDTRPETLSRLVWAKPREQGGDGIPVEQLAAFQVAYNPERGTIILPHHNINGKIVGLYERSFGLLRKDWEKMLQGEDWYCLSYETRELVRNAPRSKYMPLRKTDKYQDKKKWCWSFPNSRNLYGLHRAKAAICESGKAIIFEGAKSVMLAHAYGYPFAVASHTFGASENHIAMLIQAGAKEIILAFDKQYQDCEGQEWEIYQSKTQALADRVGRHVAVSRICDRAGTYLQYKDAPIDRGREVFERLFAQRELLTQGG